MSLVLMIQHITKEMLFNVISTNDTKTMYNTQSAVINNGHISEFYPLERGVRDVPYLHTFLY